LLIIIIALFRNSCCDPQLHKQRPASFWKFAATFIC